MIEKIHVFHTNDVHSHFDQWPRAQAFIKEQRTYLATLGEPSFLVDVGDHVDRSNIFTEATLGKGNVQLLNEAGYDVVTIGNNEGITLAHEDLYALYDEAKFDVVVANVTSLHGPNPKWLKQATILTTASDVRIGIVGATAQYEAFYEGLGWQIDEPREKIKQQVQILKPQVDIVLCLSHLGLTEDELLAQECPEIDVIFGAHTHHIFEQGKMVADVLLTGGGKFGWYTGHLTISFDHDSRKVTAKTDRLIENEALPELSGETDLVQSLYNEAKMSLQQPLFLSHKTYTKEWFHYSPLANEFAQAILSYTSADCAMFNAGIFLGDLQKGQISALDFHKILPHPINLCVIELTGDELKEILVQSKNDEWPQLEVKGLGFRGIIFGKMLTYQLEMDAKRVLLINGEVANPDQTYRLVTLDMYTYGFFFPTFKYAKKQYYLPLFLRDILLKYLLENNQ